MIRLKSLLFEVSLDQLKTQFVDTGKITDSEFTEIIDSTGGKSAYATWLTKMVVSKIIQPEDLYKYNSYFKIFDRRKREYPFQDINQYKTSQDISQFILKSVEILDKEKSDPAQQKGVARSDKYQEFYIGSVDGFDVYELPKSRKDLYGASCELGSGTEWCTATGKTRRHFDRYISKGPLFIFIKPGSNEKYQFSYETNSFMDKDDISIVKKITNLFDLFNFIESKRPQYRTPFIVKLLYNPDSITDEDLNVKGNLDLADTKITSLPDNLKVGGYLNLSYTPIKKLPDNLKVKNDLYLSNTPIKKLPDNLKVGGYLSINDTPITSLPDNLTVDRIYLANTPITSLPNNLNIKRELTIRETPISAKYTKEEILKMITDKGGSINGKIYVY
jgi:hypothetical protein